MIYLTYIYVCMYMRSQALQDYSVAVEKERDHYGEALRAAEETAEAERQARLELSARLEELQRKVRGLGGEKRREK